MNSRINHQPQLTRQRHSPPGLFFFTCPSHTMPSDDYKPVVRGGLKLKGATTGITKTKTKTKKPKKPKTLDADSPILAHALTSTDKAAGNAKRSSSSSSHERPDEDEQRQHIHAEDEISVDESAGRDKTASERAYDEMRRKRVRRLILLRALLCFALLCPRCADMTHSSSRIGWPGKASRRTRKRSRR